jgi:hypothetical protein
VENADAEALRGSCFGEGSAISPLIRGSLVLCIVACASLVAGCAGSAWKQARKQDTIAAYHRFLRDHPESRYTDEARMRFEYHQLKRQPNAEGMRAFADKYPDSPLLADLRPLFEEHAFAAARAAGTAEAYEKFLGEFGEGALARRAEGNAAFLRADGFGARAAELASFAERHPESDFAAEARRSVQALEARRATRFDTVGLSIDVSAVTPGADRLRRTFEERAVAAYSAAGMRLISVPTLLDERTQAALPRMRLVIRHQEEAVRSAVSDGQVARPGIVATTLVTLREGDEGQPVWSRTFTFRVDAIQRSADNSILFGPTAKRFWDGFFVPVATWQSVAAVRPGLELAKPAVAIDTVGSRAVVAFEDGNFQMLELSDPSQPLVLAEYERPKDLKQWSGVRLVGDAAVVFGVDGFEVVRFTAEGARRGSSRTRDEVGSIVGVEAVGRDLIVAGNRGLFLTDLDGSAPVRLLGRPAIAIARVGPTLAFTDGEAFLLSTVSLLRQNRVLAQLRLGKGFGATSMRAFGSSVAVIGETGVITLDLAEPRQPRVVSRLRREDVGRVEDVAVANGRLFLIGERGVQVVDPGGRRALESIDVLPRTRMRPMGRHLVAIGGPALQIVDATPFLAAQTEGLASPQ